ncbi:hypothetical protein Q8F55_000710 [Vanrija albida]|uniref:Pseudouridine synthase RsuA/RluA-like domain-containing protein n=1 Tax=Vanrija albida TaxID=181172 RepID=A0ABR3QE22_9TREE
MAETNSTGPQDHAVPVPAPAAATTPETSTSAGPSHDLQADADERERLAKKARLEMYPNGMHPMLRYCTPYWWPYKTFAKQRWLGRRLLEVVATEFRDRSVDYYRHALECGVTRVNGVPAYPDYIVRDGDRIDNTVHRHEPPVSNDPVLVLHVDKEREFIVISKPGSMPVHAAGRYFKHTLLEILKADHGIKAYSVNRLDRLTSGLMILALSGKASARLAEEFKEGRVKKEYVARVRGKFPDGEITVDQPLLSVDRQMGLVIVAPEGKESQTIFKRMSYDEKRDQSVVHCRPLTGRTHQLRVHLQYLGYPIANDPLYSQESVWGPGCGKGGVDLVPQGEQSSQIAAIQERRAKGLASGQSTPPPIPDDSDRLAGRETGPEIGPNKNAFKPREFDNVDITSPIYLSAQARNVIGALRRQRDEAEDWVKWKEVVWATKKVQDELSEDEASGSGKSTPRRKIPHPSVNQAQRRIKAVDREMLEQSPSPLPAPEFIPEGFCHQCFIPVADDPDPETLFIYLHALRYHTEPLGTWETPLPRWAGENWDGDWRGWDGEPPVSALGAGRQAEAGKQTPQAAAAAASEPAAAQ